MFARFRAWLNREPTWAGMWDDLTLPGDSDTEESNRDDAYYNRVVDTLLD